MPPDSYRRVYLLRHGAVDYYADTRVAPDAVLLSDEGRAQAGRAAEALVDVRFDRAVASGFPRTIETAQIVLGERTVPLEEVSALVEIHGVDDLAQEVFEDDYVGAFRDLDESRRFLGGETFGSLLGRVVPAFEALCAEDDWSELLLVAHGVVNRAIIAHVLGVGLPAFAGLEQDAGCINILDVGAKGGAVRLLNYTPCNPVKVGVHLTTMEELYLAYRRSSGRQ